jgi:hypothetical protein
MQARLRFVRTALVCALVLVGCGRDDAGPPASPASPAPPAPLATAERAAPAAASTTGQGVGSSLGFDEVAWETGVYDLAAGWGLSWADADGDGDADLFVSNHMHYPSALYLNQEGLLFRRSTGSLGVDVGLDDHLGVWADVDGDGLADLYSVNGFHREDRLMRNRGDGAFEDATGTYGLTLGATGRGRSALWADLNGDGWLDLLVLNLYTPDLLYLRDPESGFEETALDSGLGNSLGKEGAAVGDLDDDGDLDVYLPLFQRDVRNLYFVNRGDGTFVERSAEAGVDLPGTSRGASLGDYDGDGHLDLHVTRGADDGDVLLRNRGDGTFEDVTARAGALLVGDGARNSGFADLDNDGWLDLYVTRGGHSDGPTQPNALLHNRGDGTFEEVGAAAGVEGLVPGNTASLAFADYDLDGFLDVAVTNGGGHHAISGPHLLFRNRGAGGGRWLRVLPRGGPGNTDGFGARVRVRLPDGRILVRETGGARVMAQDEAPVHVGLGTSAHARDVCVSWTDGTEARLQGVPADQTLALASRDGRLVGSHPAALLGEVPTFDLAEAEARAAALHDAPLPEPPAGEVRRRADELLAWALARRLAADLVVEPDALDRVWEEVEPRLGLPERVYVEHIGLGRFTLFDRQPRLPWEKARAVGAGLRAGRDVLELALEEDVRPWAAVFQEGGNSTEPLLGAEDTSTRGYVESGWLTRAMLVERYGEEHTAELWSRRPGGVHGPIRLREGRDVQDPARVWPLLRFLRPRDRAPATPAVRADHEDRLARSARRRALVAVLSDAAAPHTGAAQVARHGWIEGVRYDVEPLAAAARARDLETAPVVRAALARLRTEAALDAALRADVRAHVPPAKELDAHLAARREVWTRPSRVKGTKLFFVDRDAAEDARARLLAGAGAAEVIDALAIPPLTRRGARGGASHHEELIVDRSLWSRIAPGGSFAKDLAGLGAPSASAVLEGANGWLLLAVEAFLADLPDPLLTRARAAGELRRRHARALVDEVLWGPPGAVDGSR